MATSGLSETKRHPIQVVARRSGLSADVLRAWEKRYRVIAPSRSPAGRRLYSDADIERLKLIQSAIGAGRRIGQLAHLSTDELVALVEEDRREATEARVGDGDTDTGAAFLPHGIEAVHALDASRLKVVLTRAVISLSPRSFIDDVAAPLMEQIGKLWYEGQLTPGHEHLATSVVRHALAEIHEAAQPQTGAACLVVATPANQRHEIGAMLVSVTAAVEGWRVTYLGADLPAEDIAAAAVQAEARAVALSIVYPPDDPHLAAELKRLRMALPNQIAIMVGGRSAPAYGAAVDGIGGALLNGLASLRAALDAMAYSPS